MHAGGELVVVDTDGAQRRGCPAFPHDQGKEQPEGLSGLLSALLKAEQARRAENAARFATLSMEPIHRRFWDSPEEEDAWEGM